MQCFLALCVSDLFGSVFHRSKSRVFCVSTSVNN